MKNFLLALISVLLVMVLTKANAINVNETPIKIKKESILPTLSEPVYAAEAPVAKIPTPAPKPAPVASTSVQQLIINAANKYGVDSSRLLRIAKCESSFNPLATNKSYYAGGGNPTGLFQYLPETWTRYQRKLGVSGWDIYNPQQQAELTAFAFSIGGSGEWECK